MKKKTIITLLIMCFSTIYVIAQCRVVRGESTDSLKFFYYGYDQTGKLASYISKFTENGAFYKYERQFAYGSSGKCVQIQSFFNDTLSTIESFIYKNELIVEKVYLNLKDTMTTIGTLFYNDKRQATHYVAKKSNGDTVYMRFDYAPEGYLKRHTRLSDDKYGGEVLEMAWDLASIPIDPERTFFADSPLDLLSDWTIPTVPLSVKGNLKGRTTYKIEKDGKLTKQYSEELFDNKANASGYLVENKYKTSPDNKVVTFRAFFEGCKN